MSYKVKEQCVFNSERGDRQIGIALSPATKLYQFIILLAVHMTVLLPLTLDKRLAFRVTRRSGSLVAVYPFVLSGLVADGGGQGVNAISE